MKPWKFRRLPKYDSPLWTFSLTIPLLYLSNGTGGLFFSNTSFQWLQKCFEFLQKEFFYIWIFIGINKFIWKFNALNVKLKHFSNNYTDRYLKYFSHPGDRNCWKGYICYSMLLEQKCIFSSKLNFFNDSLWSQRKKFFSLFWFIHIKLIPPFYLILLVLW